MANTPNWHSGSFEYFDERRIALNQEVKNHPILIEYMQKHPQNEFEMLLAEIASYCEVILKGDYYPSDIDNLCEILTKRLIAKRTGLVLANPISQEEVDKNS